MTAAPHAHRLPNNPIITPEIVGYDRETLGENINGPSLIRVPEWLPNPLGKYYLYFANHGGTHIRLAYADDLQGPWRLYEPGTLRLEQTDFVDHIASPDVHVDPASKRIRMYFHGPVSNEERESGTLDAVTHEENPFGYRQYTRVALSSDGLRFEAQPQLISTFYLRVFEHNGWHYGIAMPFAMYRSRDGITGWEKGPMFFGRTVRHCAVQKHGDTLRVFFTRRECAPEHVETTTLNLLGDWFDWRPSESVSVLKPEMDWEGADEPMELSSTGAVHGRVHQLRDPAVFEEDGRTYLLYSVAGESGIAIAELR